MLTSIVLKNIKPCRIRRPSRFSFSTTSQSLTRSSEKSDLVPTQSSSVTADVKSELNELPKKEDMQWRTPWHQKEGNHYRFLRVLYTEDSNVEYLKFLQLPINLTPSAIKKWWLKKKERMEIITQQYIPERNQTLGNELAAAHFIVYRGGSVKFYNEDKWIKADDYGNYCLPVHYQADKTLQAIDCTDMNLHYEGLVNLRNLKKVEWLSLNGCKHMDDWCMDRVSNIFDSNLIYLDLRNCPNITERGLGALYKLSGLKFLYLDDILRTTSYEMTCLMLQELNPSLDIRIDE